MKSQERSIIVIACLLTGAACVVLGSHAPVVQAAVQHLLQIATPSLAQPAAYVSNATLRIAAASDATPLDASGKSTRSPSSQLWTNNPVLPQVEEFTLTPPDPARGVDKSTLAVRFPELAAEKLAAQIPLTLGNQRVVIQRSSSDSRVFLTQVDFDWSAFAKEQQQRKYLATAGKVIPVFENRHVVRMEKIEFVDPIDILSALKSNQSIQFSSKILEGTGFTIVPDHELMITNLAVVTDPSRTWDSCSSSGTAMGAWTFGKLVTAMTGSGGGPLAADAMVQAWLNQWMSDQTINTNFTVAKRTNMATFISTWARDSLGNVDVSAAPLQLNAIVNRIDLGAGSPPTGGELRFVFGFCSTTMQIPFNVIVEYGVPASVVSDCTSAQQWANEWHSLDVLAVGSSSFNSALQAITDQVVTVGADVTKPFHSALDQIRTNETQLAGPVSWEQRQFTLMSVVGKPTLREGTLSQTPDSQNPSTGDFNGANSPTGVRAWVLTDYINQFQPSILDGTYTVPASYTDPTHPFSGPFLGGSAFNTASAAAPGFWNGCTSVGTGNCVAINSNQARSDFSLNTCNGCHGKETANNPSFQQVLNRQTGSGSPSSLSAFLVGCSYTNGDAGLVSICPPGDYGSLSLPTKEHVQDPVVSTTVNTFGDILFREGYMSNLLSNCTADQLLRSVANHKTTFVH